MIFADGLPGSGKSTTAAYVAGELEQRESHAGYSVSADRLNVGGDLHPGAFEESYSRPSHLDPGPRPVKQGQLEALR